MNEQWKKDIQRKLADLEQPAPSLDWDSLFRAVDEQRAARRRKTAVLWRSLAAAAVVGGVLVGSAVYLSHTNEVEPTLAQADRSAKGNAAPQQDGAATISTLGDEDGTGSNTYYNNGGDTYYNIGNNGDETPASSARLLAVLTDPPVNGEAVMPTDDMQSAMILSTEETPTCTIPEEQPQKGTVLPTPQEKPARSVVQTAEPAVSAYRSSRYATPRASFDNLTAKAYVAGALGSSDNQSALNLVSSSYSDMSSCPMEGLENDYPTFELGSGMDRQVKHHQPLRLGLSLRYQLSPRWSVEGGISYSHHTTDITESSDNYCRYTEQSLTFIGIPVNMSYSLWSNRHFNIYASAGGEVERLVNGKTNTRSAYNGQAGETTEESIKMDRPVLSVNAAIGAEVKAGDVLSIFAEPGVGYHFKNGSSLQTIYTDKPFNASLNLGIRFSLK